MNPLDHPRWAAHVERVAEVGRLERSAVSKASATWSEHDARMRAWTGECQRAALAGEPQPPQPDPPTDCLDPAGTIAMFRAEKDRLDREGQRILVEIAPDVETAAAIGAEKLEERRQEIIAGLDELVPRVPSTTRRSASGARRD